MSWKDLTEANARALINQFGSIEEGHAQLRKKRKLSNRGDVAFPNRLTVEFIHDERKLKKELGEVWD